MAHDCASSVSNAIRVRNMYTGCPESPYGDGGRILCRKSSGTFREAFCFRGNRSRSLQEVHVTLNLRREDFQWSRSSINPTQKLPFVFPEGRLPSFQFSRVFRGNPVLNRPTLLPHPPAVSSASGKNHARSFPYKNKRSSASNQLASRASRNRARVKFAKAQENCGAAR